MRDYIDRRVCPKPKRVFSPTWDTPPPASEVVSVDGIYCFMTFPLPSSLWFRKVPTFSAQRIYQLMIMSIFAYCDYNSLGSWESRRSMIRSIEKRSLEIISPKCSQKNCDLRLIFNNLQWFVNQSVLFCIWLPPKNGTARFPFRNYFQRFHHNSLGLMSKTTTLHVHHAFLYISLPSFYN